MMVDGATRLYVIIGDPVEQVRSPSVYTPLFADAGINAVMVAAQIRSDSLDVCLHGLMAVGNLDGFLVTSPHKGIAVAYADRLSQRARTVGAINAMRREPDGSWTGDMFDGVGFTAAVKRIQVIKGMRALLFGCGGAGAAIAAELAAEGAQSIALVDLHGERAANLRDAIAEHFPDCRLTLGADDEAKDIVVNASIVGMRNGDGIPGNPGPLGVHSVVGDVVLRPAGEPTELIRRARAAGARVVTGQDMHAGQVDAILRFFTRRDERNQIIKGGS